MAEDAANGKLSAAEKKKARRQKAKQEKKQLKEVSKQVHAELHEAQEAEAQGKAGRKKGSQRHEQTVSVGSGEQVVLDYVAEPLEALQDLKAAADAAALAANPYDGIEGLEVTDKEDKAAAVAELDRIAKHFVGDEAAEAKEEPGASAPEAVEGTDAVVTTGTQDESAKRAAEEAAGACRYTS
jgi:hypothetical protein